MAEREQPTHDQMLKLFEETVRAGDAWAGGTRQYLADMLNILAAIAMFTSCKGEELETAATMMKILHMRLGHHMEHPFHETLQ